MTRDFWATAGKIIANYCLVYGKKMHPTPVGTSYTLLPYTHAPQSTLPASSHVSTIHACVSSHPHSHSLTHSTLWVPPCMHTYAPTVTLHVRIYKTLTRFTFPPAQALQLFHSHKSRPLTRAHTSLIPCHIRAHGTGSSMSIPRSGPSGLR